jgi:hypothetical protein
MKKIILKLALIALVVAPFGVSTMAEAVSPVTVGNDAADRIILDTYSDFTIIDTNNPVSADGWLSTFSFYAENDNPFQFVLVDESNEVKWISPTITPAVNGPQSYSYVVAVEEGWNLGVHFEETGTIPFDQIGEQAVYTPNNNGMPVVGDLLTIEGTNGRTYSWGASGTVAETCTTLIEVSDTNTIYTGMTNIDPVSSSDDTLFTGPSGNAVLADSVGFPGAWDTAESDPAVSGASWVNNSAIPPTNPADAGGNGLQNEWRMFSESFVIPPGATVSSATLDFTADNSAKAYLDNSFVGEATNYNTIQSNVLGALTPGTYELEFVVKNDAFNNPNNPTGLIYKVVIDYCVPNDMPVLSCPAAPAIAAAYLKSENIKPGSTLGKNIISQVAALMGPQTDFKGVSKCQTGYKEKVEAYVQTID